MEFEEFVAARGQALTRLAYVLTQDAEAAEDIVQSSLAQAFPRWSKIEHPYAYLRRAVVNRVADLSRRRRRVREVPTTPADLSALVDRPVAVEPDPWQASRSLLEIVAELPLRQRTVLVLRYYEDLADAEIARSMGIRVATVRSTAVRALSNLRNSLDQMELEMEK